jgi:hypothetical protein
MTTLRVKYKGFLPNQDTRAKEVCQTYKGEFVGAEFESGYRTLIFKFSLDSLHGGASRKLETLGFEVS